MDQSNTVKKIPFILVTGFLGSGKTSFLKQMLVSIGSSKRIAIIQNEFAPGHVDGAILKNESTPFELLEINNGSVFCACLLDDFISKLANFTTRYQPEVIVLEATGLADPIALAQVLQSEDVAQLIYLAGSITLVDCLNFEKAHQYIKQVRHQIQVADIVLLNKIDLHPETTAVKSVLAQWNPFAKIFKSQNGAFSTLENEINQLLSGSPDQQSGRVPVEALEGTERAEIGSCVIRSQRSFTIQQITDFHARNKSQILRMKGFTKTNNGRFLAIQSCFEELNIVEIPNWWGPTELIIIGPGIQAGPMAKELLK